jgi:hypothetical protein
MEVIMINLFKSKSTIIATILIELILYINPAHARIAEFQTTRLKSTGGAGVASFLVDEAPILNPAPIAFFNMSSIYFQKGNSEVNNIENSISSPELGDTTNNISETDDIAFIASDSKGALKGTLGYIKQSQNNTVHKKITGSLSSLVGKKSSMGFSYSYNKETTDGLQEKSKEFNVGVFHAMSPKFSLGMVAVNPFISTSKDTKGMIGLQYTFQDFISIMLDAGADYTKVLSETIVYKAGAQLKIYNDFFLRFGMFDDKSLKEKGSGAGIGWVQPRLTMEFAIKNTKILEDEILNQQQQDLKETSFSVSYRF